MTKNRVIGKNNQIPWHISDDLKYFKRITLGKPIVMGRLTHESIGKPLQGRQNIILTRESGYTTQGCTVVHSVDEALEAAGPCEEVMVIGGGKIFEVFLPMATRLYVSLVDKDVDGDAFFPEVNWRQWKKVKEERFEAFVAQVWDKTSWMTTFP